MTDYVLRHINRTRIVDIFRRKLRIWSTVIKEDIDNRVDNTELIADNARFHPRRRAGCPDFYKSWEECSIWGRISFYSIGEEGRCCK